MAEFIVGTGTAVTPIQHQRSIFKNYLRQLSLRAMMGKKDSGQPIVLDDTLKGQSGESVVFHFIPQNDTDGIVGQNPSVEGNEDTLEEYTMTLTINQLAKSFRKKGKMTDKRIVWNFRDMVKQQLTNWWTYTSEDLLFLALTGWVSGMPTGGHKTLLTSAASATATTDLVNGTGRCIRASGANSSAAVTAANSDNTAVYAAMTTADKMSPRLIEDAVIMAKLGGTYKIAPVKIGPNGEEFYILMVHTKAARDLRFHPDWQARALSCKDKGIETDPIATGALGIWNNCIVKESERVLTCGVAGTKVVARNLLMGSNAAVLAWAQTQDYVEEKLDANRVFRATSDEIRGQSKITFNGVDMGVAQVLTDAT
jgi:N4-gp56 family major capsid protein